MANPEIAKPPLTEQVRENTAVPAELASLKVSPGVDPLALEGLRAPTMSTNLTPAVTADSGGSADLSTAPRFGRSFESRFFVASTSTASLRTRGVFLEYEDPGFVDQYLVPAARENVARAQVNFGNLDPEANLPSISTAHAQELAYNRSQAARSTFVDAFKEWGRSLVGFHIFRTKTEPMPSSEHSHATQDAASEAGMDVSVHTHGLNIPELRLEAKSAGWTLRGIISQWRDSRFEASYRSAGRDSHLNVGVEPADKKIWFSFGHFFGPRSK